MLPPDQSELLDETAWDHLIIMDGGRADVFAGMFQRIIPVNRVEVNAAVDNGSHTYTAPWFAAHFDGEYPDTALFHGGVPIHAFAVLDDHGYDEREHFGHVAAWGRYGWGEGRVTTTPPSGVHEIYHADASEYDRTVVRYLQPHNPYVDFPHVGSVADAREHDPGDLRAAYEATYEWVLGAFVDELLPALSGRVVVTADHGQCLGDCGQYLHGPDHVAHAHLTRVPWLVIEA